MSEILSHKSASPIGSALGSHWLSCEPYRVSVLHTAEGMTAHESIPGTSCPCLMVWRLMPPRLGDRPASSTTLASRTASPSAGKLLAATALGSSQHARFRPRKRSHSATRTYAGNLRPPTPAIAALLCAPGASGSRRGRRPRRRQRQGCFKRVLELSPQAPITCINHSSLKHRTLKIVSQVKAADTASCKPTKKRRQRGGTCDLAPPGNSKASEAADVENDAEAQQVEDCNQEATSRIAEDARQTQVGIPVGKTVEAHWEQHDWEFSEKFCEAFFSKAAWQYSPKEARQMLEQQQLPCGRELAAASALGLYLPSALLSAREPPQCR